MTAAKRMRRADIVDLKEVLERFEEFDGVAGKGKGGLTEFRCELLNLYFRGPADHHLSKGHFQLITARCGAAVPKRVTSPRCWVAGSLQRANGSGVESVYSI